MRLIRNPRQTTTAASKPARREYRGRRTIDANNKMTPQQAFEFGNKIMNGLNPTTGKRLHHKLIAFINEINAQRLKYLGRFTNYIMNSSLMEVINRGKLHLDQQQRIEAARSSKIGTTMNSLGNAMLTIDAIRAANRNFALITEAPYWFTDAFGKNYVLASVGTIWVDYVRLYEDGARVYTTKDEWLRKEKEMQDKWGYYNYLGKWIPGTHRHTPPHETFWNFRPEPWRLAVPPGSEGRFPSYD